MIKYQKNFDSNKGIVVGLDLRWKYDVKLFPVKKLASDWLTLRVNQSETSLAYYALFQNFKSFF